MKKILITEEQLEYLVKFIQFENVNEQIKIDSKGDTKGFEVKTPIGGFGVSKTKGKEKSGSLSNDSMSFVERKIDALRTKNTQIVNFIDKTVKEEWLPKENIVRKTLSGDEQIAIWDEILKKDIYFAADIIRYVNNHDWIKQTVLSRKGEKLKGPGSETPPTEEPKYPGLMITTPTNVNTNDYFLDNSWTLTPEGIKDIEENFIQPIKEQRESSTRGCIDFIKIDTSASRFRNTGVAANMTFEELSKRRSDATYEYVLNRLNEIGVNEWCSSKNISLNYKGENGDGTSGPNPMSGNYYVPKGGVSIQATLDDKNRNEFGVPHRRKVDYDVHKFNRINVQVAFDFELPPDDGSEGIPKREEPLKDEKSNYTVKFYGKSKDKWKWKWSKMKPFKSNTPRPRLGKINPVACAKWSSKNVDKWIKRGLGK